MLGALTSPQHFVLFFISFEYYGGMYIMYLLSALEISAGNISLRILPKNSPKNEENLVSPQTQKSQNSEI